MSGSIVVIAAMLLLTAATIASAHTEDDPFTTNLIAGGGNVNSAIDAGDVLVWNDSDNLYVKYVTDGWCLTETHLHIDISPDEIPQTNGNPIPGQFDYKTEHDCVTDYVTEYTYEIPLDGYYGQKLSIAAHAEVCKPGEGEGEGEGEGGFAQGVINTTRLLAGQHIDSGTVTVAIEGENLVVTYETKDGWNLTETQLYVGTTKPEDHSPGQFPYKHSPIEPADTTDQYSIPLSDLGVKCDDTLYLAAHATVQKLRDDNPDDPIQTETGWGEGEEIGGCWAMYYWVIIPCDGEPPEPEQVCETAWDDGLDFPGKNWATYFGYIV